MKPNKSDKIRRQRSSCLSVIVVNNVTVVDLMIESNWIIGSTIGVYSVGFWLWQPGSCPLFLSFCPFLSVSIRFSPFQSETRQPLFTVELILIFMKIGDEWNVTKTIVELEAMEPASDHLKVTRLIRCR